MMLTIKYCNLKAELERVVKIIFASKNSIPFLPLFSAMLSFEPFCACDCVFGSVCLLLLPRSSHNLL